MLYCNALEGLLKGLLSLYFVGRIVEKELKDSLEFQKKLSVLDKGFF